MALTKTGSKKILEYALGNQTQPTTFYIGLSQSNEATLGDDPTLAGINETTGGSYARQSITANLTDWVESTDGNGYWQLTSKLLTFTGAFGGTCLSMFLTDASSGTSGTVFATKNLGTSRSATFTATFTLDLYKA